MSTTEPESNMYDLFVIDADLHPDHWLAWRTWYRVALHRKYFPKVATMLFAWPPTTGEQVIAVLAWLYRLHDEMRAEAKTKKLAPPNLSPIPKVAPVHPRARFGKPVHLVSA